MSYSLAIVDGDLVQNGSQLGLVFGLDKLKQDVNMWLMEQYGGDRFHLNMGSILQDFIGGIASKAALAEIYAEVLRVLQNYQKMQYRRLKENPESMSASEWLVSIADITTSMNYDSVNVSVTLGTASRQAMTIRVVKTT
jgi:phage baseplate assembly protein W